MARALTELLDTYFAAETVLTERLRTYGAGDTALIDDRGRHWMLVDRKLVTQDEPFTRETIETGSNLYSAVLVPIDRHTGESAVLRVEGVVLVQADGQCDFVGPEMWVLDPAKECTDPALRAFCSECW